MADADEAWQPCGYCCATRDPEEPWAAPIAVHPLTGEDIPDGELAEPHERCLEMVAEYQRDVDERRARGEL